MGRHSLQKFNSQKRLIVDEQFDQHYIRPGGSNVEHKIQLDIHQVLSRLGLDEQRWHQLNSGLENKNKPDDQSNQSPPHAVVSSISPTVDT